MTNGIHIGYELGSGKPISIPLQHTAVIGQTQASGKTTTLEALISRSELRALAFITKRGENSFQNSRRILPYFRPRTDWQYVAAILEATLREKLKFERNWIIKVCRGAETLRDVQRNIERDLRTARGLNESVLTTLHAYLELVLPQIDAATFAGSVDLKPGINVMDLGGFSFELQSLIMRSCIEWIYERERDTVVIIPEAWEFCPENRGSPVKLACEQLIRKGGALKNYIHLDSQDIAGVSKTILRSIGVWILGVQRERNEVKRTLDHITGAAKPKVEGIMELGLGEFYVSFGKELHKVYVQPKWMSGFDAAKHALGGPMVKKPKAPGDFSFQDHKQEREQAVREREREEEMWKEKYEVLKADFERLEKRYDTLVGNSRSNLEKASPPLVADNNGHTELRGDLESIYSYIRSRLLKEEGPWMELSVQQPELHVKVSRAVTQMDDSTLQGRLARMISEGFFDSPVSGNSAFNDLKRCGFACASSSTYAALDKLAEMGIVTKEKEGYQKAPGAIITREEA